MPIHERPGVYTDYQVTSSVTGSAGGGVVGLAARGEGGETGVLVQLRSHAQAAETFGADSNLTRLTRLASLLSYHERTGTSPLQSLLFSCLSLHQRALPAAAAGLFTKKFNRFFAAWAKTPPKPAHLRAGSPCVPQESSFPHRA